ncbi:hypothetical protein [Daejeonella sp. H1SJ63]|uniref:hypothetical protein n=1 Tax=Daejeonella sp. H1SJ63 TaxID=3034145 RepID=UPI0023EB34E4|nr:hypothetical protein [Daejeonella sp. H1SJ63]
MKKKHLITLLLIAISATNCFSQITNIKSKINDIFFNFPKSSEKFDIKLIVNSSENFYDYWESKTSNGSMSVSFEQNPLMSFLGSKNNIMLILKENHKYDQLALTSEYSSNEASKCQKQLEEVLNIFDPISYKTFKSVSENENNDLIGRGYSFYSSSSSLLKKKAYLSLSIIENYKGNYVFDIHYFPSNLY